MGPTKRGEMIETNLMKNNALTSLLNKKVCVNVHVASTWSRLPDTLRFVAISLIILINRIRVID